MPPYDITIPPGPAPLEGAGPGLRDLFPGGGWFPRGRDALEWILRRSVSGPAAAVTILTTSGSRYVSGCVTGSLVW